MRVICFVALVAGFVGGCTSSRTVIRTVTAAAGARPAPFAGYGVCTVHPFGAEANVTFRGTGADIACATFVRQFSSSAVLWLRGSAPRLRYPVPTSLVCDLSNPPTTLELNVRDVGGLSYGLEVCGVFTHAGWSAHH